MTNILDFAVESLRLNPANARWLNAWANFQPRVPTNPATLAEIERQNQEAKEAVL